MIILSLVVAVSLLGSAFAGSFRDNEEQKGTITNWETLIAENHQDHKGMHHDKDMAQSKAMNIGNTICPVSGQSVQAMGKPYHLEYNGKVYNLCCKACAKTFKKNPEKYSKIAKEER